MTETEQLKRNTEIERFNQKLREISEYLGKLSAEEDEVSAKHGKFILYELGACILMIVTSIMDVGYAWVASYFLWLILLLYTSMIQSQLSRIRGEMWGALETMRILGMIPDDPDQGNTRKKLKVKKISLFERMWMKIKRDKMEEAIA